MNTHQQKQIEIINQIENQVKNNTVSFRAIPQMENYEFDPKLCLTSVHLPKEELLKKVQETIIKPLQEVFPDYYYYSNDNLHMTIKNIRFISNPPNFTNDDIEKTKKVFAEVIPNHKKFKVYFYRLLLFPANLVLIGTTDEELDQIIFDLEAKLKEVGMADDKKYVNTKYFFSNMTLVRFTKPINNDFRKRVEELSKNINFKPYTVDSVTLLTCNTILKNKHIIDSWELK